MLLNVSRTSVPEAWISTLATKPSLGYNALDKEALVTLEKSRFSVSTIDSELFPELLSWSALMNAIPTSPCAQSIPSDIPEPGDTDTDTDTDTIHEVKSPLSLMLDPTTLEVDFDQSCFDDLDDLLLHRPFEAFAEVCWSDAVGPSSPSTRTSTPTQFLNKPAGRKKLPPIPSPLAEARKADVDESLNYYKQERFSMSTIGIEGPSPVYTEQKSPWSPPDKRFSSVSSEDEATSFILFEAPLLTPNCYNSIGHFPMPSSRPHRNMSNRIATFCSNLPASLTPVR